VVAIATRREHHAAQALAAPRMGTDIFIEIEKLMALTAIIAPKLAARPTTPAGASHSVSITDLPRLWR
jgi:hypothetical protein